MAAVTKNFQDTVNAQTLPAQTAAAELNPSTSERTAVCCVRGSTRCRRCRFRRSTAGTLGPQQHWRCLLSSFASASSSWWHHSPLYSLPSILTTLCSKLEKTHSPADHVFLMKSACCCCCCCCLWDKHRHLLSHVAFTKRGGHHITFLLRLLLLLLLLSF